MTGRRRGASLAEFVVAFTLAVLLVAAAASTLTGAERYMRRTAAASEARRVVREAETALLSELRQASVDSLRLRGDTAVEYLGLVATSVACTISGRAVVLPPASAVMSVPYSVWLGVPEAGDLVAAFDTTGAGGWRTAVVQAASGRKDGAGCTPASGLLSSSDSSARTVSTRLELDRVLGAGVVVGAPVRVLRRARFSLTRGSDRQWSLSYRRCDAAGACEASQPVAGPLAGIGDSGLVFARDASARGISIALRTPRRGPAGPRESLMLFIALRNRVANDR